MPLLLTIEGFSAIKLIRHEQCNQRIEIYHIVKYGSCQASVSGSCFYLNTITLNLFIGTKWQVFAVTALSEVCIDK